MACIQTEACIQATHLAKYGRARSVFGGGPCGSVALEPGIGWQWLGQLSARGWALILMAGLSVGVSVGIGSGALADRQEATPGAPYEIFRGQQGPEDPQVYAATTQDEWMAAWALVDQKPPRALVDGQETGIALFMGTKPTGGYDFLVEKISVSPREVGIAVRVMEPTSIATTGLTAPYVFLLVEGVGVETVLTRPSGRTTLGPPPVDGFGGSRGSQG